LRCSTGTLLSFRDLLTISPGPWHPLEADGLTGLIRVGPLGEAPGVSQLVQVRFLHPVHRGATMTVPLRWEAIGAAGGLFPVLDADLILAAEGQDKTVIAFVRGLRSTTPETRGRMESAS
jgi:hypothetical protein